MGFAKEEVCGHGFRASARTMLAQVLGIPDALMEAQLAHVVEDANGTAYNRTTFLSQRKQMMQIWADYCDALRMGDTQTVLERVRALPFVKASANQDFEYTSISL